MIFISCKSNNVQVSNCSEYELQKKSKIVQSAIMIADTLNDSISYIPVNISNFIMNNFTYEDSLNILYPLDGSCSYCIGEFLNFLEDEYIKEQSIPIHAILTSNDSSTVVYYLNKNYSQSNSIYVHNSILSEEDYYNINRMPIILYRDKVIYSSLRNYY